MKRCLFIFSVALIAIFVLSSCSNNVDQDAELYKEWLDTAVEAFGLWYEPNSYYYETTTTEIKFCNEYDISKYYNANGVDSLSYTIIPGKSGLIQFSSNAPKGVYSSVKTVEFLSNSDFSVAIPIAALTKSKEYSTRTDLYNIEAGSKITYTSNYSGFNVDFSINGKEGYICFERSELQAKKMYGSTYWYVSGEYNGKAISEKLCNSPSTILLAKYFIIDD